METKEPGLRKLVMRLALTIASSAFTAWGVYLLITGDLTNGLLALILGELIDMPKAGRS